MFNAVLTLLIIPAAFTVVDDIEKWVGRRLRKLVTADTPQPAPAPAE